MDTTGIHAVLYKPKLLQQPSDSLNCDSKFLALCLSTETHLVEIIESILMMIRLSSEIHVFSVSL